MWQSTVRRWIPGGLILASLGVLGGDAVLAAPPIDPPETAIPVNEGTLLYVRYGEPGAVHIQRRNGVSDSAWAASLPDTATIPAATPALVDPSLAALLREILRQELDSASPVYLVGDAASRRRVSEGPPGPGGMPPRPAAGIPDARSGGSGRDGGGVIPVPLPLPLGSAAPETVVVTVRDTVRVRESVPVDREILRRQLVGEGLIETNLVLFEIDRDRILDYSENLLATLADILRDFPEVRVRVEGHTDHTGSEAHNLALSRRRAQAVVRDLVERGGISADRIEAQGFGESRPLAPNRSATERALNRRVTIRVLNPEVLGEGDAPRR